MTAIAEQINKYRQSTEKLSRSTIHINASDEEQTNRFLDTINEVRLPLGEIGAQLRTINEVLLKNFNQLPDNEVDFLLNLASDSISKTRSVLNKFDKDVRLNFFKNCLLELTGEVNHFEEIIQDIEKRYRPDTESQDINEGYK
ncbi:MAG: hypothetical protein EOM83_11050 [Clostridia bacterium]|nr:hypothetical protein [Clostridia bacterium]